MNTHPTIILDGKENLGISHLNFRGHNLDEAEEKI